MTKENNKIAVVKEWVEAFVVHHNLCPFAKTVVVNELIKYTVSKDSKLEAQFAFFVNQLESLDSTDPSDISTSILIYPNGLDNFEDYLSFYYACEELLANLDYNEEYQLASFHPGYIFSGLKESDPANMTNRSPFPLVHILRVTEVSEGIKTHPDIHNIGNVNQQKMRKLFGEK